MTTNPVVKTMSYGLATAALTFATATAGQAAVAQRLGAAPALSPLAIVHTMTLSPRNATSAATHSARAFFRSAGRSA